MIQLKSPWLRKQEERSKLVMTKLTTQRKVIIVFGSHNVSANK